MKRQFSALFLAQPRYSLFQLLTSEVRAHAFVCLGKLCLRNEKIAKKSIALFVRELEVDNYNTKIYNSPCNIYIYIYIFVHDTNYIIGWFRSNTA